MTPSECVPTASQCVPDAVRPQCVHASPPLNGGRTRDAVRGDHTSASHPRRGDRDVVAPGLAGPGRPSTRRDHGHWQATPSRLLELAVETP